MNVLAVFHKRNGMTHSPRAVECTPSINKHYLSLSSIIIISCLAHYIELLSQENDHFFEAGFHSKWCFPSVGSGMSPSSLVSYI